MSITLLGAGEIRQIAESLDLRPTKSLGQNFVIDSNICQKIVRLAGITSSDHVVEIGPGLGSLTLALLQASDKVTAIEIDKRLADQLEITAKSHGASLKDLVIINADAMEVDEIAGRPDKLVANLPYNISVPVLLTFLEKFESITSGIVMVQSEVAERLAAKPGSKIYGVPSAKAAWWADLQLADSVSRSIFWPVPKVDSSLVKFTRHKPLGDETLRKLTFELVDRAFGQRRKMLRSIYADLAGGSAQAEQLLIASGIEPTIRGEALTIDDFLAIARQLDRR
ncbi:MAG: 16S rRNA (adenine(1518)-N(6)/adenine(1519)-N(6))-dimethyltransferase RsmA [Candidatus Nanopelagicaceae bacterium]|nr:16S rRNA (adenine(1518)-N(6)/adenine(1519)-N(6))-dimethyltransferase RsmA [Candidatus Nanopelagicaceae bacterium]